MNIKELIQRIRKGINHREELSDDVVVGFLRILEDVRAEDASCEEIYDCLDEYVEKQVDGKNAAILMPLVREHLDMCSECCEEYEALLDVLEKTADSPPDRQ
ncbi:MAG: hypothetical protein AB1649_23300 [Chloroflexota bacterium]